MGSSEVIASMMEKVNEGLAGISTDQMTVVVAMIAIIVVYVGLMILLDLLWSVSGQENEKGKD